MSGIGNNPCLILLRFEKFNCFAGRAEESCPATGQQQCLVEHGVHFGRWLVNSANDRFALGRHRLEYADHVLSHK